MSVVKSKAIPDGYKWWIVASVGVLLVSLAMFAGTVVAGFVYFSEKTTPVWVTVLGVVSVLGTGVGFGGLLLILVVIWLQARRSDRKLAVEQG